MRLGWNKFRGADVIITDWRRIQDPTLRDAFRHGMACSCCTTVTLKPEEIEALNHYYDATQDPYYQSLVGKLKPGEPFISIDLGLTERCSANEMNALLLHEYSHVKNKDHLIDNPRGKVLREVELRCDEDAAKVAGAKNMRNGLIKLLEYQIDIDYEHNVWKDLDTELANADMVERLNALADDD